VLNLSDTSNSLRVTGGAAAGLTFDDLGWVRGATAGGFTTYSNGQAQVEVQTGVQRLNAPIDLTTIAAGTGGFVIHGQDAYDLSGWSVASAGDINGDGFADLIIGAPLGDAAGNAKGYAGDSYVVFGKASGWGAPIDLATIAAGTGGFVIHGQDANDRSGVSVASAGDINGDGFDDLIIGAWTGDAAGNAKSYAGESYVIFGRDFTNALTHAGTASAELLTGTNAANVMVAGLGNDTLDGFGGADALKGGAGDDRVQVADLAFLNIDGGSGTDTLVLTGTGLTLDLAAIPETRLQSIEAIELGGNALRITALEVLNLSDSTNTLRVTGDAGAALTFTDTGWVRGANSDGFVTFTNGLATLIASESLVPSAPTAGNDTLDGTSGDDTIDALGGADLVRGLAGNDSLMGGDGTDTLDGGVGADSLQGGSGNDRLDGGNDADTLSGGSGADHLIGGEGLDWATYAELTIATQSITVNLATGAVTGAAGNDLLSGIDNVHGGAGNDSLFGDDFANLLAGAAGNDRLNGGGGNDTLDGGAGADTMSGGNGDDVFIVGDGDVFSEATGQGTDLILLRRSAINLTSIGVENVTGDMVGLAFSIIGNTLANILTGGALADTLNGGSANDTLLGGAGADCLIGGAGIDVIDGGAGDDLIMVLGAEGEYDTLQGGAGADRL
ncbi:MAG: hypothetical protein ACK52I_30205, partial [Pseudomonadota bacterium]